MTGNSFNCGDILKIKWNVVIVACSTNGALSIYKRDRINQVVDTVRPIVSRWNTGIGLNKNIACIEHIADGANFTNLFVFATTKPVPDSNVKSEILGWEILIDELGNST